eukprot:508014-Alexandrium_andersonii.AAC.1
MARHLPPNEERLAREANCGPALIAGVAGVLQQGRGHLPRVRLQPRLPAPRDQQRALGFRNVLRQPCQPRAPARPGARPTAERRWPRVAAGQGC